MAPVGNRTEPDDVDKNPCKSREARLRWSRESPKDRAHSPAEGLGELHRAIFDGTACCVRLVRCVQSMPRVKSLAYPARARYNPAARTLLADTDSAQRRYHTMVQLAPASALRGAGRAARGHATRCCRAAPAAASAAPHTSRWSVLAARAPVGPTRPAPRPGRRAARGPELCYCQAAPSRGGCCCCCCCCPDRGVTPQR